MEIDYDYLRTGTAIGFRASHELCSNYLFKLTKLLTENAVLRVAQYQLRAIRTLCPSFDNIFYTYSILLCAKAECFARLCHRLGVRPSVRLSVRPSVRHTPELYQNGAS